MAEKMGEGEGGGEGKNDYLYEVPHPTFRAPFGHLTMTRRSPSLPGWSPELIN